jgi:predicted nucleotidyltransferase
MARSAPQSTLRYPLTRILGADANVRVLRELVGHGGRLSAPALVVRSGLAQSSVRAALISLEEMKIVEAIGFGRARLFCVDGRHPLAASIAAMFDAEDCRFAAVLDAVRAAATKAGPGVIAVWLYGSVARREDRAASDVDLAVVAESGALGRAEEMVREALREAEEELVFSAAVLALDLDDVVRLGNTNDPWWTAVVRDAMPVVGDRPEVLAMGRPRRARGRRAS